MNPRLICLLALAWACGRDAEASRPTPTAVRLEAVELAPGHHATRYSAAIVPSSRVELAFKVGGYVASIAGARGVDGRPRLLQEGDRVTRGQELAALRRSDYQQRLDEAKAALAEAVASREQAQLDGQRAARLLASDSISQAEADASKARADGAVARAEGARVRVEEARTALLDTSLRSPLDGVVLERRIEIGTLASPGVSALSVADLDTVKAVFAVPDMVVRSLRLGAPQSLTLEAFRGRTFAGRISRIGAAADSRSRSFEVEVSIPNPRAELKPGMIAALELREGERPEAGALLPLSAVVRAPAPSKGYAVYVVQDGLARVRPVELGDLQGNKVAVRSGLSQDEQVVVMGAPLLADGEPVQVIP